MAEGEPILLAGQKEVANSELSYSEYTGHTQAAKTADRGTVSGFL